MQINITIVLAPLIPHRASATGCTQLNLQLLLKDLELVQLRSQYTELQSRAHETEISVSVGTQLKHDL
jgi:hypothetical protein